MSARIPERLAILAASKAAGVQIPANRRKPRAPKVAIKEKDLQAMAEDLCIAKGIRFFRLPDSLLAYLARCSDTWVRVFNSRYLAGTPDLMLFAPRAEGDNIVRFIEIKTEAGKVSQGQSKWHSGLKVNVCHGWQETEDAILGFEREALGEGLPRTVPHPPSQPVTPKLPQEQP